MPQLAQKIETRRVGPELIAELPANGKRPVRRVQLICDDPSLTKQAFTKDSNIRTILGKYAKFGIDPSVTRPQAIFGDFSRTDFEQQLINVTKIKSEFETLNVKIRERFKNNPAELLEFLADKKNDPEAVELGLKPSSVLPAEKAKQQAEPPASVPAK